MQYSMWNTNDGHKDSKQRFNKNKGDWYNLARIKNEI